MLLSKKLLNNLHRAFDIDPEPFLALRVRYDGDTMRWKIEDNTIWLVVTGGLGASASFDLTAHTIKSLAIAIVERRGYSVEYMDAEKADLSAMCLLDATGDQDTNNGDHLLGYSSIIHTFANAMAVELVAARKSIIDMLDQMSIRTADNEWLDEWGGYFGIQRLTGEHDREYGNRIIAEIIMPRENNKAIELAILSAFGQESFVVDANVWGDVSPLYNASIDNDGVRLHNAAIQPAYGLFDVQYGYDVLSGADPTEYANNLRAFIERFRAAGTHLRALALLGSRVTDSVDWTPGDLGIHITIVSGTRYLGSEEHDGEILHGGLGSSEESF